MGAVEFLILLLVLGILVAVLVFPTVYGAYSAFRSGRTGWGIGILAGWLMGIGWLVGIVYLAGPHRRPIPG